MSKERAQWTSTREALLCRLGDLQLEVKQLLAAVEAQGTAAASSSDTDTDSDASTP